MRVKPCWSRVTSDIDQTNTSAGAPFFMENEARYLGVLIKAEIPLKRHCWKTRLEAKLPARRCTDLSVGGVESTYIIKWLWLHVAKSNILILQYPENICLKSVVNAPGADFHSLRSWGQGQGNRLPNLRTKISTSYSCWVTIPVCEWVQKTEVPDARRLGPKISLKETSHY